MHDSLIPFSLDEFEVALRRVSERPVVAGVLLEPIDHRRPIILRLPPAGHGDEVVGGKKESERWRGTDAVYIYARTYIDVRGTQRSGASVGAFETLCLSASPQVSRARDLCDREWTHMLPILAAKVPSV